MRVGLSMLTLVPGSSGGSETYARALVQGSGARSGRSTRTASRADARAGRRRRPSHGRRRRVPRLDEHAAAACARWRAAGPAAVAAAPAGRRRRRPLPAHDAGAADSTSRASSRSTTSSISTCRSSSRAASAASARVAYDRAVAPGRPWCSCPASSSASGPSTRLGLDPARVRVFRTASTTSASAPARRGARALPPLPGEDLAAQEPRAAARGLRAAPARGPGAAARPHRRRPRQARRCRRASRHAGSCRRAELADLYRRAACLVFPSLYEGFGTPLLEAMACGARRGGAGRLAARGLRRRGRALRPERPRGDRGRRPNRPLPQRRAPRARPRTRRRVHLGGVGGTARRCVRIAHTMRGA